MLLFCQKNGQAEIIAVASSSLIKHQLSSVCKNAHFDAHSFIYVQVSRNQLRPGSTRCPSMIGVAELFIRIDDRERSRAWCLSAIVAMVSLPGTVALAVAKNQTCWNTGHSFRWVSAIIGHHESCFAPRTFGVVFFCRFLCLCLHTCFLLFSKNYTVFALWRQKSDSLA